MLLGHVKLEHTVIYLHLSRRHLHAVGFVHRVTSTQLRLC
jgi:site-specific recombinase XerD